MNKLLLVVLLILNSSLLIAGETIVLTGFPEVVITEKGVSRISENVVSDKTIQYKCTITNIDGKYYWTTRENKELHKTIGGIYTTYIAMDGSGYVRVIDGKMKGIVSNMLDKTELEYDYVEHLLLGLQSITYYGKAK